MSDAHNPYKSPKAEISSEEGGSAGNLTETMVSYLKDASPWMRFVGIMGFIGAGFMAIGAVGLISASPFISGLPDVPGVWGVASLTAMGLLYLGVAALVFFPARFTYFFGEKIRRFLRSNSGAELEGAFKNNRSLWKFIGILTIINLAIIPVFIIVAIVIAVYTVFM
ncbi:MAG: DUF5362 domain-containing protein [Treponema sp.]|jgi:hypothetical protein|nr:DUF5362 domain-containing protein [Treponema sp.]